MPDGETEMMGVMLGLYLLGAQSAMCALQVRTYIQVRSRPLLFLSVASAIGTSYIVISMLPMVLPVTQDGSLDLYLMGVALAVIGSALSVIGTTRLLSEYRRMAKELESKMKG